MTNGLYLAFGLALFLSLHQGRKGRRKHSSLEEGTRLLLSLVALAGIDFLSSRFLWNPSGRTELRWVSILLWALLISGGSEERFLPLAGISLWVTGLESLLPPAVRLQAGTGIAVLAVVFKAFLEGMEERLRLSDTPKIFEGLPIHLLTASLGALVLAGIAYHLRLLVAL